MLTEAAELKELFELLRMVDDLVETCEGFSARDPDVLCDRLPCLLVFTVGINDPMPYDDALCGLRQPDGGFHFLSFLDSAGRRRAVTPLWQAGALNDNPALKERFKDEANTRIELLAAQALTREERGKKAAP